jgi:glutamine amidotransferase
MAAPNIVIVDYQAGNLRSVQKALERSGAQATITSDGGVIQAADALVFPGQGACDSSMRHLRERGLVEPITAFIRSGRPFFGVCLGLQLLLEGSDEGVEPGLGILKGRVRRLPEGLKVPHIGWNQVKLLKKHLVLDGVPDNSNFYFVHSYYADPDDRSAVAGVTSYGVEFCSVAAWQNVIAVQFHPEKSGETGLKLYDNFVRLVMSTRTPAAWR